MSAVPIPVVDKEVTGTHGARPVANSRAVIPSRYHVGLAAVLGAIFLVALAPKLDTDLWWHLKDGAYIWTHHAVATRDYLSFTFAGRPWTDHEWLSDLLLYGCYRLAGLWGTIVVFAAVICATFFFVYRRMVAIPGNNPMLCLFVLAGAFIASSATWGARPQMLTLFFLALYALTLDRWLRTHDRRLLALFPLVAILWTNLHAGWVLGIALLAVTLMGEWLNHVTRHPDALPVRELRALALTIVLTLASTALNPAGLHEVFYPLVWIFPTAYSNVLSEWVSSDFHQPVTMVFEGLLLALIASAFIARQRLNWTHLLVVLAFTYLALGQSRNVAVWSVVVSPLLAFYLQQALNTYPRSEGDGQIARKRSLPFGRRTETLINASVLVLTVLLYLFETFHFVNAQALRRDETSQFPAGATAYMQTHRLSSRTFSAYAWGGYLLWKLYPHYRDFIDGRANTLFDDVILRDYLTASTAAPGWEKVLDRYRIGTVVIEPTAPLAQVLALSHGWRRDYRDGTAVVFARR